MHVTLSRHRWRLATRRRPFAAMLMLALAGLGSFANAVEFDEKLKSPAMKNVGELRTQAQSFAARFGEIRAATPAQLITNTPLARQQFDFKWQIQHAIDQRQPLDELAALGFVDNGNGSYSIDMNAHPEWSELPDTMIALVLPDNLEQTVAALVQRGFGPEDIATFRDYVATHDARAASAAASPPLALGFGRVVRKYDKLKLSVPDSLVLSFFYQRARVSSDSNRAWAEGLLKRLDAQRRRILLSAFLEVTSYATWAPEDIASGIADTLAQVRQPDFEQRVTAESKGVVP